MVNTAGPILTRFADIPRRRRPEIHGLGSHRTPQRPVSAAEPSVLGVTADRGRGGSGTTAQSAQRAVDARVDVEQCDETVSSERLLKQMISDHEVEADIGATRSPGGIRERGHRTSLNARYGGQVEHDRPGSFFEVFIEVAPQLFRCGLVQRSGDVHQRNRGPGVAVLDLEAFFAHDAIEDPDRAPGLFAGREPLFDPRR